MTKQHNLGFLASRILEVPLMVTRAKLDQVLEVVGGRIGLQVPVKDPNAVQEPVAARPEYRDSLDGSVAVVPIHGTLVHRVHGISALSGMTSYSSIRSSFRSALNNPDVDSILLDIDSPGGEIAGLFDLVDEIYNARGVKTVAAMINERGYSAAYAIASAAENVYLTRTAGVGSIGVIMIHVDRSEADAKAGLKYTPIYAGARKIDGSPHSPLSKEAAALSQTTVDEMYSLFVSTVARNNGLSEDVIRDTQAAIYRGQSAIDNGLANAVLSYQEVINKLKTKGGIKTMAQREAVKPAITETAAENPTEPVVTATPGDLAVATDPVAAPVSTGLTQADITAAVTVERDRTIAIIEACNIARTQDLALDLICDGSTIETTHKMIMSILAERTNTASVTSVTNPAKNGSVNPVLADARRRAEAAKQTR